VSGLVLGVNDKGEAMLTYTSGGRTVHVLAWGAENALAPIQPTPQPVFQLAYDGGYTKYFRDNPAAQAAIKNLRDLQSQMAEATAAKDNPVRYSLGPKIAAAFAGLATLRSDATNYWQTFTCPTYDGPALKGVVATCKAPDGSYWAVESRGLVLADQRVTATVVPSTTGVQLAHWTGDLATSAITRGVATGSVTGVTLGVNDKGEAMLSYASGGKTVHVLAWSGGGAIAPAKQVSFQFGYDGGYTKYFRDNPATQAAIKNLRDLQSQMAEATAAKDNPVRYSLGPKIAAAFAGLATLRSDATNYWQTFTCPSYDGPALADMVAACKAPDGSYWAVQSWPRDLPDYGVAPTAHPQMEVQLAHWTGALPILTVHVDWAYGGQWNHLWGTYIGVMV
jgi:hypothetical protein